MGQTMASTVVVSFLLARFFPSHVVRWKFSGLLEHLLLLPSTTGLLSMGSCRIFLRSKRIDFAGTCMQKQVGIFISCALFILPCDCAEFTSRGTTVIPPLPVFRQRIRRFRKCRFHLIMPAFPSSLPFPRRPSLFVKQLPTVSYAL